jgi:uncharacterized protein (DUF736 family)
MIIGIFRSIDDGFAGQLYGAGFEHVPIAIVPTKGSNAYNILIAGKDIDASIEIGQGALVPNKDGGYLDIKIDAPILAAPIRAIMKLKASRLGTYNLEWKR